MEKKGKVISFYSSKGGTGKSTLTMITASAINFLLRPEKVCIIDGDSSQASLVLKRQIDEDVYNNDEQVKQFCDTYGLTHYPIIQSEIEDLLINMEKMKSEYDYVFVDFPGTMVDERVLQAVCQVDYMIIPLSTDELERTTFFRFVNDVLPIICRINPELKVKVLFNLYSDQFETNSRKVNPYEVLEDLIKRKNLSVFESKIYRRIEFANKRSTLVPLGYRKSKDSIYNFINEFVKFIQNGK